MSEQDLQNLTAALDVLRQARRQTQQQQATQQALHEGRKPHAPRSGRPPQFGFGDQVLTTILHQRLSLPEETLAMLLTTSRSTIRRGIVHVGQLLDQHGTSIKPITAPEPLTRLLTTQPPIAH